MAVVRAAALDAGAGEIDARASHTKDFLKNKMVLTAALLGTEPEEVFARTGRPGVRIM